MQNAGFCKPANVGFQEESGLGITLINIPKTVIDIGALEPRYCDGNDTNIHATLKKRVTSKLMNYF